MSPVNPSFHSKQFIYRPDGWIVLIYIVLVAFGLMNIYATQSDSSLFFDFTKKHGAQFIWILFAIFSATALMIISDKLYSVFAYYIYGAVALLLMVVLLVGIEVNGSKSWLALGSVRFQPAELAKLATSLALARFMCAYDFKLNTLRNWFTIVAIILFPVLLILLQRDWGSALVFSIFMLMLYREGMSGWVLSVTVFTVILFIATLMTDTLLLMILLTTGSLIMFAFRSKNHVSTLLVIIVSLVLFSVFTAYNIATGLDIDYDKLLCIAVLGALIVWLTYALFKHYRLHLLPLVFLFFSAVLVYSVDYVYDNVLKTHHRDRIEVLLGLKSDIQNAGYNVYQAKVAIGSGGFMGKRYLQGTQTKLSFVPEQSTDFIFCTVGEEWGFVGTSLLIVLFAALLIRIIVLSEKQKDKFTRMYGYCIASIIFFHVAVNISMTIGFAPVIGIPLPFISAGGSSLWCFTLMLFIFLRLNAIK